VSSVEGWVGGEHGTSAIVLWSTVKVNGVGLDDYLESTGKSLERESIESYVKSVSKLIVDNLGGTEFGPAASFRDIVRAIVKDSNELLSVATPMSFDGIPEPVHVSVPVELGKSVGKSIFDSLSEEEKTGIRQAAEAIYQTFITAINC
jgi:malate dehydrogenase